MAISVRERFRKKDSTCARRRLTRSTGRSAWSTACKVNTALDVSMPMRLISDMDGSLTGWMTAQVWHSMPWGRPPQQAEGRDRTGGQFQHLLQKLRSCKGEAGSRQKLFQ